MQLEMIYRLAQTTQLQDDAGGPHITKMSHYCDILAKAAGLGDEERQLIFHAMAIRDVGKLGISDSILHKPGRLTDLEFTIMKNHSIIGARLLSGNSSPLLKKAREIALTHHERWDGSGYPAGLSREEIPLAGRIAAICDVFDALTSIRPYKGAWSAEKAFAELETEAGSKFDPQLAALFLQEKNSIMEIRQRFSAEEEAGHA
jgi:putative two-component system response regulator